MNRFHSLDAVRAFALLAGIFLHATLSFLPGMREANWPISDDSSSVLLAAIFFVVHIFRMSLFYAIAGFFAHLLLERLGAYGLIKNRLRRIALPFVASYHYLVRSTFVGVFLNGRKYSRGGVGQRYLMAE